jgi:hypothetical protein
MRACVVVALIFVLGAQYASAWSIFGFGGGGKGNDEEKISKEEMIIDTISSDEKVADTVATDEKSIDAVTSDEKIADTVGDDEKIADTVGGDEKIADSDGSDSSNKEILDHISEGDGEEKISKEEETIDTAGSDEKSIDSVASDGKIADTVGNEAPNKKKPDHINDPNQQILHQYFMSSGGGFHHKKQNRPDHVDSNPYVPEAVGLAEEDAMAVVKKKHPDKHVVIVKEGDFVTMDVREDRIRIWVNDEGVVRRTPRIG